MNERNKQNALTETDFVIAPRTFRFIVFKQQERDGQNSFVYLADLPALLHYLYVIENVLGCIKEYFPLGNIKDKLDTKIDMIDIGLVDSCGVPGINYSSER